MLRVEKAISVAKWEKHVDELEPRSARTQSRRGRRMTIPHMVRKLFCRDCRADLRS